MALFTLYQGLSRTILAASLFWLGCKLSPVSPQHLDGAVFGPMGVLAFSQGLALATGGLLSSGLWGLWPSALADVEALAPVPSAAPLHVGGLLGAGFFDLSTDGGWAFSPVLSFGALILGGLWSRRLGPHREIWSWDVVEITAVDLLGSEIISDHLWQRRPSPVGVLWGGAEVRLFRTGLAASHHHLSSTGTHSYSTQLWAPFSHTQYGKLGIATLLSWPASPTRPPLRVKPLRGPFNANAPLGASEGSLAMWSFALFAPSSGAIAAWGLWGGAFYLWLLCVPLFLYFRPLWGGARSPLWLHYSLVPLFHWFATPLPWAPATLTGYTFTRSAYSSKSRPMGLNG